MLLVISDEKPSELYIMEYIYNQASSAKEQIAIFDIETEDLPPELSLHGPSNIDDVNDPAFTQFRDMLGWTSFLTEPDPGMFVDIIIFFCRSNLGFSLT